MATPKRRLTPTSLAIKRLTDKAIREYPETRRIFKRKIEKRLINSKKEEKEALIQKYSSDPKYSITIKADIKTGPGLTKYFRDIHKYLVNRKIVDKEVLNIMINFSGKSAYTKIILFYHKKLRTKDKQKVINHMQKIINELYKLNDELYKDIKNKDSLNRTIYLHNYNPIFEEIRSIINGAQNMYSNGDLDLNKK